MKTIRVFHKNQPCLEVIEEVDKLTGMIVEKWGMNRDRHPDTGWDELRNTDITYAVEVELTDELKQILLEDLAYAFGKYTSKFRRKLIEFEIINGLEGETFEG